MSAYDDLLARSLAESVIPGLGAIVLRANAILWQGMAGWQRVDRPDEVRLDAAFHIGSNTKAMTSTVAALMVLAGEIAWHTRPVDMWPEIESAINPAFRDVTLLMLLQHQAGIPPFEEDIEFTTLPDFAGDAVAQRRKFAQHVLTGSDVRATGTYSNAGYGIAGAMLEAASGSSWEVLLQSRLFDALELSSAGFGWPALVNSAWPWGHRENADGLMPHPPDDDYQLPVTIAPAGDVHINLSDYACFLQLHLRGLRGQDDLLPAEIVQFLHQPVGRNALGWGRQPFGDTTISAHSGSADTFYAVAIVADELDLAIAVFANAWSDDTERAAVTLLRALFAAAKV